MLNVNMTQGTEAGYNIQEDVSDFLSDFQRKFGTQ